VVVVVGDAFQARFPSSEHAVMAAIGAQRRLQAEDWPLPEPLRVRMALHAATCGREVPALTIWHELGMVLGAAHGDQIIATEAAVSRADAADGDWRWRELGKHLVRGMAEEISLYQVVTAGDCVTSFHR
jgi:class 3 adenylate cyclase